MGVKFLQLLEDSVILQASLTLAIWGVVLYMAVTNQEIPQLVGAGAGVILGYYFGNKQAIAIQKALKGG